MFNESVYLHVSNSGAKIIIKDENYGPQVIIETNSYGNLLNRTVILTDKEGLVKIKELIDKALVTDFSEDYCNKAKYAELPSKISGLVTVKDKAGLWLITKRTGQDIYTLKEYTTEEEITVSKNDITKFEAVIT